MIHFAGGDVGRRQRAPEIQGLTNLRDLGGHAAATGTTLWQRGFRSEGLHRLDRAGVQALRSLGIATVIDLRGAREVALEHNPFASGGERTYVNVPLFGKLSPLDLEATRDGFDLGARYVEALEACAEHFAAVFRAIARAEAGAVLIHCTAGKDRTGLVAAVWLLLAGVSEDLVVEDYLATAVQAQPMLDALKARNMARTRLPEAVVSRFFLCEPDMIGRFIERLNGAYGGAAGYLARAGLGETEVERARRHLLG
jgi:protein-tyrosine phosphatase